MSAWLGCSPRRAPSAGPVIGFDCPEDAPRAVDCAGAWTADPPLLCRAALAELPEAVRQPRFDVGSLRPGILHLGCGAFHRAHQALLTQHAIEAGSQRAGRLRPAAPPAWGIVSVSLRTPGLGRRLGRQQGLYTVLERVAGATRAEVVGSLTEVLYAPERPMRLSQLLGDPSIRLITLTVTSEGYGLAGASGRLDVNHLDIAADLRRAGPPRSSVGLLVAGLAARRAAGLTPPVLLSCDNLPGNGRLLRQACIDFAAALGDDGLAGWIGTEVQFPCSMVDRIVPVPSPADADDAVRLLGHRDAAALSAEPFCQWVIERFDGPRPDWEAAGAEFVADVVPWETSKLRLLNGGHLALAYLGLLAGARTAAEAMERPGMVPFLLRFMLEEQRPTLPVGAPDTVAYAHRLIARWRNHGLAHQLVRIGRDGAAKLPARLLASLRDNLHAGRQVPCTLLAVAAWMGCAPDPSPRPATGHSTSALAVVDDFLARREVFGDDLPRMAGLRLALAESLQQLRQGGVEAALASCLARCSS